MASLASSVLSPSVLQSRSNLEAALRGYTYQDAVVCYLMLQVVARQEGVLTANKTIHQADKFDDVATANARGHIRRQLKHSSDANRQFRNQDLTTRDHRARIDDLIRSHRDAGGSKADEYRLCATWLTPTDPDVLQFLEPLYTFSSFADSATATFRLNVQAIWPVGQTAQWKYLKAENSPDITREHFVEFAERFVLELECPSISNDFNSPGSLEKLILNVLHDGIGIGRYPNKDRVPVDVAAGMLWLAQKVRVDDGQVTLQSIESFLRLRRDFGRVAQKFPLEENAFVRRSKFQNDLRQKIECAAGGLILLTGLPGAGKSWLQEALGNELQTTGYLVARHYCYLEPGDAEVQKRITSDAMWGNIIAELLEISPALRKHHQPIYAADLAAFEKLLPHAVAASPTGRVVLFVDGLDHIARVRGQQRDLSQSDTDIVEQLQLLRIPDGVTLVLGSQPGPHLEPIRGRVQEITLPDWSHSDVEQLALRRDLHTVLRQVGKLVPREWQRLEEAETTAWREVVEALHARCEGNPLYATFLCLELLQMGQEANALHWHEKLEELPAFSGRISNYYEFLLKALENEDSQAVYAAELLGVVDFGLTADELREIFPFLGHRIERCLHRLQPILKQTSSQGGIRIYHESFRRFILEQVEGGAKTLPELLQPLLVWLQARDFYFDVKAYRFLLPNLRRAGQLQTVLDYLETEFVARSVAGAQPRPAINANLALGFAVASELGDWAALCRFVHLRRASMTFEGKLEMLDYGGTFAEVFGTESLIERLLFDGYPTMIRQEGLFLCSIGDSAGQPVPWEEYLNLPDTKEEGSYQSHFNKQEVIAEFQGRLRTLGWEAFREGFSNWLEKFGRRREQSKAPNGAPARESLYELRPLSLARNHLRAVAEVVGVKALQEVFTAKVEGRKYTPEIAALLQLEIARMYRVAGQLDDAHKAANLALMDAPPVELIVEAAQLGCDESLLPPFGPTRQQLSDLAQELGSDRHPDPFLVNSWVWMNTLSSWTNPANLSFAQTLPQGVGWYRRWLQFVPALIEAENVRRQEIKDPTPGGTASQQLIARALENLASNIIPFEGETRACDLYLIHATTSDTMRRSIDLIEDPDALEEVWPFLRTISYKTTTWMDHSPSGPFSPTNLLESLLNTAQKPALKEKALSLAMEFVDDWQERGQYYELHAEVEFWRVRFLLASGRPDEAKQAWQKAAQYLTAYGMRKDVTLFEILDPLTELAPHDRERTRALCTRIQRLPDAVVAHTDGRSTNRLPISWLKVLAEVDFVGAAHLLAQTLRQDDDQIGWVLDECLATVVDAAREREDCNPLLVAFLDATQPFPAQSRESAEGSHEEAQKRLSALNRLMEKGNSSPAYGQWGRLVSRNFLAQVEGDGPSAYHADILLAEEFATRWNLNKSSQLHSSDIADPSELDRETSQSRAKNNVEIPLREPVFQANASPAEILSVLQVRRAYSSRQENEDWDDFVNALGYRLLALAQNGEERDALRLLRSFAHESHFYHGAEPLGHLAEGLLRYGHSWLATVALALAYSNSRSDGGYWQLGGNEFESWLVEAMALDAQVASEVLFNEVAHYANKDWLNGMGENLIKFCARHRDSQQAFAVWEEVCKIIEFRLPHTGFSRRTFPTYQPATVPGWTPDEALVFLLLARLGHPEYKRRRAACVGLCAAVQALPAIVKGPFCEALKADITGTTATHLLQILWCAEEEAYEISQYIYDELCALRNYGHFALRATATLLIERVSGISSPMPILFPQVHVASPTVPRWVNKLAMLDWGERAQAITGGWPRFAELAVQKFELLWGTTSTGSRRHQKRSGELMRAAKSTLHPNVPVTPCFWWQQEIFEVGFQELLHGIDNELVRRGMWTPDSTPGLLQRVVAPIHFHVALWNSRIPRPQIPWPEDVYGASDNNRSEVSATPPVITEDSEFSGWVRLAYLEEQLGSEFSSYSEEKDASLIRCMQSVLISKTPSDLPPPEAYPFRPGELWDWVTDPQENAFQLGMLKRSRGGALVGLDAVHDTLGKNQVLVLDAQITFWLRLSSGNWPERLHLVDEDDKVAVVFRQWSEQPLRVDLNEEYPQVIGCDLLMRPDLWQLLSEYLENPTVFWTSVRKVGLEGS